MGPVAICLERVPAPSFNTTECASLPRLEAVLYSLTAVSRELLALRQPALAQLQDAASWASSACTKVGFRVWAQGLRLGRARSSVTHEQGKCGLTRRDGATAEVGDM